MAKKNDAYKEMDELQAEIEELNKTLTPAQDKVTEIICDVDVLDKLPPDFFEKRTTAQLNKHFGGHDDMIVDDKVREYCILFKKFSDMQLEMLLAYEVLDENDEKASRNDSSEEEFRKAFIELNKKQRKSVREIIELVNDTGSGFIPRGIFTKDIDAAKKLFKSHYIDKDVFNCLGIWEWMGFPSEILEDNALNIEF